MHVKRFLTAIIAFPLLSILIIKGSPLVFAVFIGLVSLVTLWEYFHIVFHDRPNAVFSIISFWCGLMGLSIIGAAYAGRFQLIFGLLIVNFIVTAVLSMPRYKHDADILDVVEKELQAIIYIPLSLSVLVLFRNDPNGVAWIFFLLFIVFGSDVGAFYGGKFFGKHKLSPAISPGKTIEGSIGGLLFSICVGYGFVLLFMPHLNRASVFLFFVLVNLSAQAGDLFESELKRAGNIKDSGNILPGHGGILDRIDALLFATPVAYLFKEFVLTG